MIVLSCHGALIAIGIAEQIVILNSKLVIFPRKKILTQKH